MRPLVSVVMPARNMAPWIGESIASVRAQTYPEWELLIVDDGSTDGTVDIVERAVREEARIRLLHHEDGASHGASASRNVGLRNASGVFVGLLDADDIWLPAKLAEQVAILGDHPSVGVLYGRTMWWYSWEAGPGTPRDRDHIPSLGLVPKGEANGHVLFERFLRQAAEMPSTCSVLMRRAAILDAGDFEDRFVSVYTDQVFFAKLFLGTRALAVDRCWDWYRRRADSSSSLSPGQELNARRRYLEWLAAHLEARGQSALPVAKTVQRELSWLRAPELLRRFKRFVNRLPGRLRSVMPGWQTESPPAAGPLPNKS